MCGAKNNSRSAGAMPGSRASEVMLLPTCLCGAFCNSVPRQQKYHRYIYRADWEPAAPSGKCMASVPGVLEVPSGIVGTVYTKSSLGLMENPNFEKLANFPSMHVEMGWVCPILQSTPFATKLAPMCKKAMLFGSPPHQGLKNCGFSQKIFFSPFF